MKLSEILVESKTLSEKPMGILKRAGLGLASKVSSKAAGKLASGSEANELHKDYNFYLGSSNQKATANSLLQFLKQEGHPIDVAQKAIATVPGVDQNPETPLPKNITDQVFTSIAQGKVSTGQVVPAVASTSTQQPATGSAATPGYAKLNQVKDAVKKMSDDEKRDLIKHLKATDTFNALKLN
jgi:hypothetical protein